MILMIDWGNSYIKFLETDSLDSQNLDRAKVKRLEQSLELFKFISNQYELVLLASVRSDEETNVLVESLKSYCSSIIIAKSGLPETFNSVYQNTQQMGVDRWLSMLALSSSDTRQLVVSCGTAITIDLLDCGRHIGGQIVPGLQLLTNSFNKTGKVNLTPLEIYGIQKGLGDSTQDCVEKGIYQLIEAYISSIIKMLDDEKPISAIIFTGGGGQFWQGQFAMLKENTQYREKLVFEGLADYYLNIK
ncbi:MAG: type III pantothenate kinase [Gammaproteobacteria bacterium]|nr:type III pantothenate kinase [Gammaproteobacteria bacterium]